MSAIRKVFVAPDPWRGCHVPTDAERLAQYHLRLGQHKAALAMKAAKSAQVIDLYTARSVRAAVKPKLPKEP